MQYPTKLGSDETGAAMVEYSVLLVAIAAVCILTIEGIGLTVLALFQVVKW